MAEPIIAEAETALNSLDKASLGELKSFGNPATEVINVVSACMVLTAPGGKIPKVASLHKFYVPVASLFETFLWMMMLHQIGLTCTQDLGWAAGKKSMGNVDAFLKSLVTFNKEAIPLTCVEKCEKDYISNPTFNASIIRTKSGAAAGLCGWVINVCKYFRIYQVCIFYNTHLCCSASFTSLTTQASNHAFAFQRAITGPLRSARMTFGMCLLSISNMTSLIGKEYGFKVVAPKRVALAEANKKLTDANRKLESIRARVKELHDRVSSLEDSLIKVRVSLIYVKPHNMCLA